MNELIIFIILLIPLVFVMNWDALTMNKVKKPVKTSQLLIVLSRIIQVTIIFYLLMLISEAIYYFLAKNELPSVGGPFKPITSIFDWGIPVLLIMGICNYSVIYGMLELTVRILRRFRKQFVFDKWTVKRLVIISNLLALHMTLKILISYFETGLLSIEFESLFIYGLMVIFVRIFVHAKLIQEDSDLAI